MKKLTIVIGILFLAGIVAVPVLAWGPHMGWGGHMMGNWTSGPGYGNDEYTNLTPEQKSNLEALDQKFFDETKDLRDELWTKSEELDKVLNSSDPDIDSAKTLQKEISDLRTRLDEKTLTYQFEARKIVPDQRLAGNGTWYGHHMGTYGGHMMGYGSQGYCWN